MQYPQLDEEDQDRKAAELNDAVWSDIKSYAKIPERDMEWVRDFITVGEVYTLVRWNENAGEIRGYSPKMDDDGQPMYEADEFGVPTTEPVPDMDKPVFKGRFEYKDMYGFNITRDPGAKNSRDTRFLIHKELYDTKTLNSYVGLYVHLFYKSLIFVFVECTI